MAPRSAVPAVALEPHAAASQRDALLLETNPLREHPGGAPTPADAALRVDHAVPRHVLGARTHRAADRARGAGRAEPRRDLAVRHDVALGNAPHEAIDLTAKAQPAVSRLDAAIASCHRRA